MIDYEILKLIWWLFIAVLLTGFAIMDGQDMGAGTLLPFLGKTNEERRIMINAVAPHWDGNEVWLLTGAGAMFAAWPIAYATAFSGFYWALLIVLFMLIFRPVAFDYRTLHGARGNEAGTRRRAFSLRLLGDDARYVERPGRTSPPYPGHGMVAGQRLREDWFPILV